MGFPTQAPTSLTQILPAIQAQIQLALGWQTQPERVNLSTKDVQPRFRSDQDCYIRLMDITPRQGFEHGSGRTCIILSRPMVVTLRTRLQVDPSDIQNAWLLDPTYGHWIKEEALFNGLVNFVPLDSSGNWLTAEVLHPLPTPPEIASEKPVGKGWGQSHLTFELVYQFQTNPGY